MQVATYASLYSSFNSLTTRTVDATGEIKKIWATIIAKEMGCNDVEIFTKLYISDPKVYQMYETLVLSIYIDSVTLLKFVVISLAAISVTRQQFM